MGEELLPEEFHVFPRIGGRRHSMGCSRTMQSGFHNKKQPRASNGWHLVVILWVGRHTETIEPLYRATKQQSGGEGGIRTLDRVVRPYNGLANRRLQPLGHLSVLSNQR